MALKRFLANEWDREARSLARLNHPHIVGVYDYGEAGGYPFLILEYVQGLSLWQLLQSGKLAPPSQKARVDARLDEVVLRALEKEPAKRYQQASEVKTDLQGAWVFRPREGGLGLLELNGWSDNPPGVKIRYQRVPALETPR